jgi:hypothetical protein
MRSYARMAASEQTKSLRTSLQVRMSSKTQGANDHRHAATFAGNYPVSRVLLNGRLLLFESFLFLEAKNERA